MVYPYGQDAEQCLEKSNPSMTPVSLASIQSSYKIAWPVGFVGCVPSSVALASVFLWSADSIDVEHGAGLTLTLCLVHGCLLSHFGGPECCSMTDRQMSLALYILLLDSCGGRPNQRKE